MANAIARVYVNDIEVGALPADQYDKIVNTVRANRRIYVVQAVNYCSVLWRFLTSSLRRVPILWFVMLVAAEVFAPSSVTNVIAVLRQATPALLNQQLCSLIWTGWLFSMVIHAVYIAFFSYPMGYVNEFEARISRHIRSLLEVPAEGTMMVIVSSAADK
ncbi:MULTISPECIES: hypothetical protein [Pandoraea]|uniref:Uncharacterized protein n=2 Tax=Pandoraea TaxID=93217 RepID=A0A5E4XJ81_9BURK|nr:MULTISPECIES: hypothetical protein [Pandoraea]VVE18395.1 hypothetical protein PCE31107_03018 [Pandoraea cepalis]VVE36225.1 hypothetical protein PTE31013_03939 [Pandoraea terrigena]